MNFAIEKFMFFLHNLSRSLLFVKVLMLYQLKMILRYTFMLWLACKNRIGTKDRVSKWNTSIYKWCCLCGKDEETLDHLLFCCPYSAYIWTSLQTYCLLCREEAYNWQMELQWFSQNITSNSCLKWLRTLFIFYSIFPMEREEFQNF